MIYYICDFNIYICDFINKIKYPQSYHHLHQAPNKPKKQNNKMTFTFITTKDGSVPNLSATILLFNNIFPNLSFDFIFLINENLRYVGN